MREPPSAAAQSFLKRQQGNPARLLSFEYWGGDDRRLASFTLLLAKPVSSGADRVQARGPALKGVPLESCLGSGKD